MVRARAQPAFPPLATQAPTMTIHRRAFLTASASAVGAVGLGIPGMAEAHSLASVPRMGPKESPDKSPARKLKILILGGTNLTGPHNVRYAIERGHEVTIFTRGKKKPGLFQDVFEHVEHLVGDREDNLEALKGRSWDAVIDASGRKVAWTEATAQLLKDAAQTYLYISSTGVFYPYRTTEISEATPPVFVDSTDGKNGSMAYGVMKALSENAARAAFGAERTLVIRPGYIVGPLDRTHRGTYWPTRLRRGGEVLVPGKKTDAVQQIDVRDLTEFMVRALEAGASGTFNVTGPGQRTTMEEFVYGVKGALSSEVTWTWVDDYEFLEAQRIGFAIPWILPTDDHLGSQRIDISKAKAAGLTFRPIATTAIDTLDWYDTLTPEQQQRPRMAISPEKEAKVLTAWKNR